MGGTTLVYQPPGRRTSEGGKDYREPDSNLSPVPEELYLREVMAIDLEDATQILDFVARYGPVGNVRGTNVPPQALTAHSQPGAPADDNGNREQDIEWVRLQLSLIRDAARMWNFLSGQISVDDLADQWESDCFDSPADTNAALIDLAWILNAGLGPFHAQLQIPIGENIFYPLGRIPPDIYSILCLQLFNHVVENAVYRRCHNEKCERLFVRQRGRSKTPGRNRLTGVLYCSDYCARAQGQRDLRKNKKDTIRKSGNGGES